MNDQDRPTRHPAVETALFGTEAVLYDERSGMVHHLNGPACAIWRLLDGRPVADVVAVLCQTTGVGRDHIRRDVIQTIGEFDAAELLGR